MIEVYIDGFRTRGYGIFNIFKKGWSRFSKATPIDVLSFREANDKDKFIKGIVNGNENDLYNFVEISKKTRTYIANRSVYTYNRMEKCGIEFAEILELLHKHTGKKIFIQAYSLGGTIAIQTISNKRLDGIISGLNMFSSPIRFTWYTITPVYQIFARIYMRAWGNTFIRDMVSRKFYKRTEVKWNEMVERTDFKATLFVAKFTKRVKFLAFSIAMVPVIFLFIQPAFFEWIMDWWFISIPFIMIVWTTVVHLIFSDGMIGDRSQLDSNLEGIKTIRVRKKGETLKTFGNGFKSHKLMTSFPHNLAFYQLNSKLCEGEK